MTAPEFVIDTPAQHWVWLLEEACYLIKREVRPMALVEIPKKRLAEAEHAVEAWGLWCRDVGMPGTDLAGLDTVEIAIGSERWVLALYARCIHDRPFGVAIIGLLLGYSVPRISEFMASGQECLEGSDS